MDRRTLMTAAAAPALIGTALVGTALVGTALVGTAMAQGASGVAERFAAALGAHDMAAFAALFADDYVNHQTSAAAPAPPPGRSEKQATIGFFAARLAGIPDLTVTIEAMVANAERVAASFVYAGTHGGAYLGFAPTGRPIRFTSCDIFTVRDGLIVEHWGMGDAAGVLAQLRG